MIASNCVSIRVKEDWLTRCLAWIPSPSMTNQGISRCTSRMTLKDASRMWNCVDLFMFFPHHAYGPKPFLLLMSLLFHPYLKTFLPFFFILGETWSTSLHDDQLRRSEGIQMPRLKRHIKWRTYIGTSVTKKEHERARKRSTRMDQERNHCWINQIILLRKRRYHYFRILPVKFYEITQFSQN